MFESLRDKWAKLLADQPGKRFRRQYERRQDERSNVIQRVAVIAGGFLIILAGIFFLPAPGPGTVIIFVGLGVISQEYLWMAVLLDKVEIYLRELAEWSLKEWRQASWLVKGGMILAALIIAFLVVYGGYVLFW